MDATNKQRCRYLYVNPRGFRNEFQLYRVRPEQMQSAGRMMERHRISGGGAGWITRREAETLVAAERRLAREYKRAGLDLYTNPVGATEIDDYPSEAI